MPVQQALETTATTASSDYVSLAIDTLLSFGQFLNPSSGSWLAIGLAAVALAGMVWKKLKSKKK